MRYRRIVVTGLASVVVALIAAAPASAYLRNFHVVQGASPMNSTPIKGQLLSVVPCGATYIGGLAFVSPPLPNLALSEAQPFGGFLYGGVATDTTGSWRVFARGLCAENTATPPTGATAAGYVKGVEYRTASSSTNSLGFKSATATCPTGKTVIGGGGRVTSLSSNVALVGFQRTMGVRALRATAHEVDPVGASWKVGVRAICANITSGTPTTNYANNFFQTVNPPTPPSSSPAQFIFRACPAGWIAVGGGARILGGATFENNTRDVALVRSEPFFNGSVWGWFAQARETDPTAASWRVNATVTCVTPNGGPPI